MNQRKEFEAWYKAYPRKTARADAFKAWQQTAGLRPALAELLKAIDRLKAWREQLHAAGDFVPALPYPATWLRGERWADEFDDVQPQAQKKSAAVGAGVDKTAALRAWSEVRSANARGARPSQWADPRTAAALAAMGGFGVLADMRSDQAGYRQNEFVQHFLSIPLGPRRMAAAM